MISTEAQFSLSSCLRFRFRSPVTNASISRVVRRQTDCSSTRDKAPRKSASIVNVHEQHLPLTQGMIVTPASCTPRLEE